MLIVIHFHGISASQALETHVRQRIRAAVRPFREHLSRIDAYLQDLNGPKGGRDKVVRLEARLMHRPAAHICVEHRDFYAAAVVASRLLKRAVRRDLERSVRMSRRRHRPGHDVPAIPAG